MKNTLKTAAILAGSVGLLAGSASAQTSPVVGFETLNVIPGFNFLGARLHENPVISGDLEAVSATDVTDSDAAFDTLLTAGASYILEIDDDEVGGPTGVVQVVTSWTATTLATTDDLTAAPPVTDGATYSLRPAATLASIFGAGPAAATILAASTLPDSADQVWLPNGAGGFDKYFLYSFFGSPAEWRDVADPGTAGDIGAEVPVIYTDGVVIQAGGATSFVVSGDLKATDTSIVVVPGFNFLGSVYPVGSNLTTLFGATPGASFAASTLPDSADQVWIPNGAGGFNKFFLYSFFGSTPEWRSVADPGTAGDVGSTAAASFDSAINGNPAGSGSGYIIQSGATKGIDTAPPAYYSGL